MVGERLGISSKTCHGNFYTAVAAGADTGAGEATGSGVAEDPSSTQFANASISLLSSTRIATHLPRSISLVPSG
jgi:hypothetical protein